MSKKTIMIFTLSMLLLAGCSSAETSQNIPGEGESVTTVSVTTRPTRTSLPTHTATATVTVTPLPSSTFTPQPSPSPTFSTDFSGAALAGVSYQADWQRFYLALDTAVDIQGEYYATVEGNRYSCQVYTGQNRRLTCWGPSVSVERWLDLKIFELETQREVYQTRFMVPLSAVIPDEWIDADDE